MRPTDNLESPIDLAVIAVGLAERFRAKPPTGYLLGKTSMRDAVMDLLHCSAARAEELVDRLEGRGFISYTGDPAEAGGGRAAWSVDASFR